MRQPDEWAMSRWARWRGRWWERGGVRWLAGALLLCLCVTAAAQEVSLPEREAVEARLAELTPAEGEEAPSGETQETIERLEATLADLDALAELEERREALEARVDQAPQELMRLERELADEEAAPPLSATELDDLSLDELESRQQQAVVELQRLQDRLAEVNAQLLAAQTLPERAQQAIAEAMQAVEQARRDLDELDTREVPAEDPRRWRRQAARALAEARLLYHQRELSTNTRLRELDQQRRDLLARQQERQEAELALMQSVIERKRRIASEQAIADAVRDDPLLEEGHPVLERAQQINRELSQELLRANDRSNVLVREGLAVRSRLDQVRQLERSLNEQIDAIRGSTLLSRILREQRRSLPQVAPRRDLQDEIADLRLRQFDLVRQRDQLREGERLARQRLEEAGVESSDALVDSLQRLYQSRRELVDRLEQTYGSLLSAAIELQLNQQQLLETSRALRATIDEQLFWVANTRPLDLAWVRHLPANLVLEWQEGEWRQVLPTTWQRPSAGALVGLLPLLLAAALLWGRRRIQARLATLHEQIGRLRSDTQLHTPLAILLNALLAGPGPLLLVAASLALWGGGDATAHALGLAGIQLALAWGVIAWSRRLLVADGVATQHFHWPLDYAARLRRLLGWLGVALVPVLAIAILAREAEFGLSHRPVALSLLLLGLLAVSFLLARLILAHTPFFGVRLFRLVLGLAMAAVPLGLVGLVVAGFEYTALSLVGRFVMTLYLLGLWILVEAAVVRGLAVAARRLAFRRALARRRAEAREGADGGPEVVEEPPLDMEQINQQSLRLSKLILLIAFALLLYLVWADLLTVLGYLEQVAVWGAEGEGELVADALTVADIATALLIVALTLMLARNLPGLLEVSVLSRLELKQGSAYAITSLLSYTIVGTGLVASLGTLGVSWDKLQWLVAALGVGLGFGLQEIFANFVSGLIILFERPVRIGDTVTLGNLTGTVSRIRIRATTVTDFDRKEIIIPNKTFVTDQLINWSLSDTITRVVLTYGVAYGSDHRLVHRLLRQAASENARVLADPEPQVFFMSYGASTLDFELRIFVNSLGDRLFATDELNCRVGELFAEHGIEIAFNQLDVRLHRASDGLERRVERRDGESLAARHPAPGAKGDPGEIGTGDADGGEGGGEGR
ncbi:MULTISPECIES: mechanosensitive channel MscK [Halomonas]|uniref:Potassium efflux system protein n=1 Tax=Halomonas shengliensis TaxID=419597 RepID=A0A1H0I7S2_9GAMM|nr:MULTISPECIES: mechanosensitive channel MscK [Halomonas]SDO27479.1 potassium efflux system protein [Halomonas shengliensis]